MLMVWMKTSTLSSKYYIYTCIYNVYILIFYHVNVCRMNMDKITSISSTLDGSLSDKRVKVSKLVRVRRLLQKLEFLSELPEKLVDLINAGQYKRAVQLYRRTITVLTKHSHLLSFKNIKVWFFIFCTKYFIYMISYVCILTLIIRVFS